MEVTKPPPTFCGLARVLSYILTIKTFLLDTYLKDPKTTGQQEHMVQAHHPRPFTYLSWGISQHFPSISAVSDQSDRIEIKMESRRKNQLAEKPERETVCSWFTWPQQGPWLHGQWLHAGSGDHGVLGHRLAPDTGWIPSHPSKTHATPEMPSQPQPTVQPGALTKANTTLLDLSQEAHKLINSFIKVQFNYFLEYSQNLCKTPPLHPFISGGLGSISDAETRSLML